MKILKFLVVVNCGFALVACGGGSGGEEPVVINTQLPDPNVAVAFISDSDTNSAPVIPDIPSLEYVDSRISLRYPANWLVNPDGASTNSAAQFSSGQVNNCAVDYTFDPSASVIESVGVLNDLMDDSPEPQIDFLEINGVSAARIVGNVTIFGITIPTIGQTMHEDGWLHFVVCSEYGAGNDDEFELILGTYTIN